MYAFNVTIQGSTRRVFASNMRVAIATVLRGGLDGVPFEKMDNVTIGAVRESSKRYQKVLFSGVRKAGEHEWSRTLQGADGERWVREGDERTLTVAVGNVQGQKAGLGMGAVAMRPEATHVAAYLQNGRILMIEPVTPVIRQNAIAMGAKL